ncbi:hypothetical protein [Natronomonas sp. EA1]|uniref:hypothetical protein n=1 Tax=Natronomonas sp. EA1 TaxID=3421655 RepID=UPI003EB88FD3
MTLTVNAGEWEPEELLAKLNEGERVVVRTQFLGDDHEVTLRWDGSTYYCDTPTRLHKHTTEEEMLTCIRKQGYGADTTEQDA